MANLKKIIDLLKKTGEKLLVLDENGDPAGLIMAIEDYEEMIENGNLANKLTEQQILDKINRDIEIWRENQEIGQDVLENAKIIEKITQNLNQSSFGPEYFKAKISQNNNIDGSDKNQSALSSLNDDHYYFEPVE